VTARTIDHVALWVADRDAIAERLIADLGMHTIERTDRFTLLGADARRFKLTLFDEVGPRQQGALKNVTLRVNEGEEASHDVGEGLTVNIVPAPTEVDYDLDHVALYSVNPEQTAEEYLRLGFDHAEPSSDGHPRVEVGGAYVEFHPGDPGDPEKPLLNHLAVLVDSAEEHTSEAEELGIVDNVVDAANTLAVFVWGPERVRIEYVEHKPGFALT
jgi:catechol 2,3-dioxygenase-like lactoylglutathione lyase family enzyme